MPVSVLMPALSPTMESGTLVKWHVKKGDAVKTGDILAEIETDKAVMEVEAADDGQVGRILVPEGSENVAVNAPIAVILQEGEDDSAVDAPAETPAPKTPAKTTPAQKTPAQATPAKAPPAPAAAVKPAPTARTATAANGRVRASPLARRIATERGIPLASITGTGPHGRIVRRDVETAQVSAAGASGVAVERDPRPFYAPGSYDEIPVSSMRQTIARRLVESVREIPHYYLTMDCRLDALLRVRKAFNEQRDDDAPSIGVNDLILRAVAASLKRIPDANASWAGKTILRHHHADIGIAVALDDGLITPIIRRAEEKNLMEISAEAADLISRARERKLKPEEYLGGTFSVSNLGMFGIKNFTAVINPPQAAILAVGAGERRVIPDGDNTIIATMMTVTLSCDHRVIDGALGAKLLGAFKGFVETPSTMMIL